MLKEVTPQDLVKFGLIPEFVGRVPISVSLEGLDEDALIRILKEPKNALVKQYQKLFELDDVKLTLEEDAIRAIAKQACERIERASHLSFIRNTCKKQNKNAPPVYGGVFCKKCYFKEQKDERF